jgi:hypothetical protein
MNTAGIIKPSTASINDIEVLLSFTPDRIEKPSNFVLLNTNDVLEQSLSSDVSNEIIPGMYILKLNPDIFTSVGFYTLIIRPKQIRTQILDCGVLSQLPDQKGIILDLNRPELSDLNNKSNSGGMNGFKIMYINNDSQEIIANLERTVTFSNKCEAITQPSASSTQKSVVYKFNDNGSLLFLSVSPSISSSLKPNTLPFIGNAGQEIIISNNYLDMEVIDIELTEYDLKKIALLINGERTLNVETGIENIYDEDRNILVQSTLYDIKDEAEKPLYKVKENNINIDETESWDSITENVE